MRRSAAILTLLLLTLSLVLGNGAVSAKPGGGNSPNAKDCQKGKYADLARSESETVAFTSEAACVSYAAMGGTLVPHVTVPSVEITYHVSAGVACQLLIAADNPDHLEITVRFDFPDGGWFPMLFSYDGFAGFLQLESGQGVVAISATILGGTAIPVSTPPLPVICTV